MRVFKLAQFGVYSNAGNRPLSFQVGGHPRVLSEVPSVEFLRNRRRLTGDSRKVPITPSGGDYVGRGRAVYVDMYGWCQNPLSSHCWPNCEWGGLGCGFGKSLRESVVVSYFSLGSDLGAHRPYAL